MGSSLPHTNKYLCPHLHLGCPLPPYTNNLHNFWPLRASILHVITHENSITCHCSHSLLGFGLDFSLKQVAAVL